MFAAPVRRFRLVGILCFAMGASVFSITAIAAPSVGVGVLHTVEWSPGDAARDGAGEFLVLLRAAQLQQWAQAAGLLAVGDHNGLLRAGGERALRRVALSGVVVAKIAPG